MARLILRPNEKTRTLAALMQSAGQNIQYRNTADGLEITGEKITISRDLANKALGLEVLSPEDATLQWRALMINREGKLLIANDEQIIVADEEEKSQWTSVRVRRDTKVFGETWADRMGVSQAQFYEEAVHFYVKKYIDGDNAMTPNDLQ